MLYNVAIVSRAMFNENFLSKTIKFLETSSKICKESHKSLMKNNIMVKKQKNNKKIGRNDPCDCGSGLKYKKCHG